MILGLFCNKCKIRRKIFLFFGIKIRSTNRNFTRIIFFSNFLYFFEKGGLDPNSLRIEPWSYWQDFTVGVYFKKSDFYPATRKWPFLSVSRVLDRPKIKFWPCDFGPGTKSTFYFLNLVPGHKYGAFRYFSKYFSIN